MLGPILAGCVALSADEGMWLFTAPPTESLREQHGYELQPEWLHRLMRASVRFNSGGSGAFVSADGLVISNHHVGADALHKLSTADRDILATGFQARTASEELPCVDLELNVLVSIEDVTDRVNTAVSADADAEQAHAARRRAMADIEAESLKETGLRSDVVTLFQGGAYHLYRYRRYTDVRLVFAPEQQIAYFGGDADNFEYPRYCLDVCFFRVYEDGQPAATPHHLTWSADGPADGELTFVSGHPGRTSRLLTVAELETVRDVRLPARLDRLKQLEVLLSAWSARDPENARRAKDNLFGVQNSRKALDGALAGLLDPAFFGARIAREQQFREWLSTRADLQAARDAFDQIARLESEGRALQLRHRLLEGRQALGGDLFTIARTLLRAGEELPKPSGDRLREFGEASLTSLELQLFSTKPIPTDLETLLLADSLTYFATQLPAGDPLVRDVLDGHSPRQLAAKLVRSTQVGDVSFRRRLYEGGAEVVAAAHDPLIELARKVDAEARALRQAEEALAESRRQAHAALAKARWVREGDKTYPDATFTLRLACGVVRGYSEDGQAIPAWTEFSGLHERGRRMDFQGAFELPSTWRDADLLPAGLPVNFVSTHDIIGGNSGSPVVNRKGEFVGIIFDGNLHSLVFDFAYDEQQARAVSVHSSFIREALRHVYGATELVGELESGHR